VHWMPHAADAARGAVGAGPDGGADAVAAAGDAAGGGVTE